MRLKYLDFASDMANRANYYAAMGGTGTYRGTATQNRWMISEMKKHPGYAKGSRRIPKDELAWTQENGQELIYRSSDGAMLTPLGTGDAVFTSEMTDRLWNIANNPDIFRNLTTATLPHGVSSNGMNNNVQNDINMEINMHGIQDVNGLVNELKSHQGFTKVVQAVTIGNALKGNSLNKYRY